MVELKDCSILHPGPLSTACLIMSHRNVTPSHTLSKVCLHGITFESESGRHCQYLEPPIQYIDSGAAAVVKIRLEPGLRMPKTNKKK